MPEIIPFKALYFNQEEFKDISSLVCPPYDVISPGEQEHYSSASPYNFINILLRKDPGAQEKYKKTGELFRSWIKDNVLVQAKEKAVYFYSNQYSIKGEKKMRLGFIALLRLGENDSTVFAHENTRQKAKDDRLNVLRATNANLSPIFVVLKDNKRIIQRVFDQHVIGRVPFIELTDKAGDCHKIWEISSPDIINFIQAGIKDEEAFIADGHHRYEVSCLYRDEMRESLGKCFLKDSSFNYTLSYFTSADQRGLSILPIHRLLRLESRIDLKNFLTSLKEYFDVEEVKDKVKFFQFMGKCGFNEHVIGFYKDKKFWLLRLKNVKMLDKFADGKSKDYNALDVSILNRLIFKGILKYETDDHEALRYSADADYVISCVDRDELSLAFFLNPVRMEQIISVALGGEKMPPKSTYFYPKVLSGLVVNRHEDK